MELFEAIARRHSYRGAFSAERVPEDDARRIVQAGIQAPSGYNSQDTRFVIVDDPALIAQIAAILGNGPVFRTAPLLIACLVEADPWTPEGHMVFPIENCAAAVENMLLAVTALGYASLWYDGSLRHEGRNRAIGALLGLDERLVVQVLLPVGTPLEDKTQAAKKPFIERAWFNRYEGS